MREQLSGPPESTAAPGAFLAAAGLEVDELTSLRVVGHIELGSDHHTPWGVVHGGVYASAVESAASLGASAAVEDRGLVAFGLTNTTHFVRPLTCGQVTVTAVPVDQGRTQQLWQVDIIDQAGRLIAHGEVRLQNVESPGGSHRDDGREMHPGSRDPVVGARDSFLTGASLILRGSTSQFRGHPRL